VKTDFDSFWQTYATVNLQKVYVYMYVSLPVCVFMSVVFISVVRYLGKYHDTKRDNTSIAEVTVYRGATIPRSIAR